MLLSRQLGDPIERLPLKCRVAHGECLVNDQHIGIEVSRDREAEPGVHAAGVAFDRRIEKPLDPGEGDDFVELPENFLPWHPHDGALKEDVFPAGQIGMEPCGHFDQDSDSSLV